MSIEFLYRRKAGRLLLRIIQKTGMFRLGAWFLHTKLSRLMIRRYIRKNKIDMKPFKEQRYDSFADFFSRKKDMSSCVIRPETLISPCDGLLTVYPVTDKMILPMKGSHYRLKDLVRDKKLAETFKGGLCLVFRLQASDYHHFCCFDDAELMMTRHIPGQLHSVQPIACDYFPVYRLNRRWWSLLDTIHFSRAVQIEVGAMMVGGVSFVKEEGWFERGEEMGSFELAGSTIILLLDSSVRDRLELDASFRTALEGREEVPVKMGEAIGVLKDEI